MDDVVPTANDKPSTPVSGPGAKYVQGDYGEHSRKLTHQDSSTSLRSAKFRRLRKKNLVGQKSIETIESSDIDVPAENAPSSPGHAVGTEDSMSSADKREVRATSEATAPKPKDSVSLCLLENWGQHGGTFRRK